MRRTVILTMYSGAVVTFDRVSYINMEDGKLHLQNYAGEYQYDMNDVSKFTVSGGY